MSAEVRLVSFAVRVCLLYGFVVGLAMPEAARPWLALIAIAGVVFFVVRDVLFALSSHTGEG